MLLPKQLKTMKLVVLAMLRSTLSLDISKNKLVLLYYVNIYSLKILVFHFKHLSDGFISIGRTPDSSSLF